MSLITPFVSQIFKDVRPGWKKIILSPELKPIFTKCLEDLNTYLVERGVSANHIKKNGLGAYIRPKPENILEAFKYFDPNNLSVIIVGQDPYPKLEEACGLSFSVPSPFKIGANEPKEKEKEKENLALKAKIPKSLNVIYKCLKSQELIPEDEELTGDLTSWARQGILLLNRCLTRSPNIKKSEKGEIWIDGNGDSSKDNLHTFWKKFTSELIRLLTVKFFDVDGNEDEHFLSLNHSNHYLGILLWGSHAQELTTSINRNASLCQIHVLEWCHPANFNLAESHPQHFIHCDHFRLVNQKLKELGRKEINWNPNFEAKKTLLKQFYRFTEEEINQYLEKLVAEKKFFKLYIDGTTDPANKRITEILQLYLPKPATPTTTNQVVVKNDNPLENPSPTKQVEIHPIVAGIDGGCSKNGDVDADASFGVYFPKEFNGRPNGLNALNICGLVPRRQLILEISENDEGIKTWSLRETEKFQKATNGRGELLALIYVFLRVINEFQKTKIPRPIYIVEDATYGINMVNVDIWKWVRENPELTQVKANQDLVGIIRDLLLELAKTLPTAQNLTSPLTMPEARDLLISPIGKTSRNELLEPHPSWQGLSMFHQNSHLKTPERRKLQAVGGMAFEKILLNEKADDLCKMALQQKIVSPLFEEF